jgi:hypothetical protein
VSAGHPILPAAAAQQRRAVAVSAGHPTLPAAAAQQRRAVAVSAAVRSSRPPLSSSGALSL